MKHALNGSGLFSRSGLSLGTRLFLRDWRAGELRTLTFSLIIAVMAVTAISLLSDRLSRTMLRQSTEMLGGDLVVSSTRQPNKAWPDKPAWSQSSLGRLIRPSGSKGSW